MKRESRKSIDGCDGQEGNEAVDSFYETELAKNYVAVRIKTKRERQRNKPKEDKVIPDPIDDRKFQE